MEQINKVQSVHKESQAIGEFLDWLRQNNFSICKIPESEKNRIEPRFMPINKSIEQLLAQYFNIDLGKVEAEKVKILNDFRKKHN